MQNDAQLPNQRNNILIAETQTAEKLFYLGFCLLPFIWLLNYSLNRSYLKNTDAPKELHKYTKLSLAFFIIFSIIWIAWIIVYYKFYGKDFAEALSVFRITRWSFMGHDMK